MAPTCLQLLRVAVANRLASKHSNPPVLSPPYPCVVCQNNLEFQRPACGLTRFCFLWMVRSAHAPFVMFRHALGVTLVKAGKWHLTVVGDSSLPCCAGVRHSPV
jgi:hypothetical protein